MDIGGKIFSTIMLTRVKEASDSWRKDEGNPTFFSKGRSSPIVNV